jgi:hypothetical protein
MPDAPEDPEEINPALLTAIPSAVFLDTSVFDGQSYNFSSVAFSTFVPACKDRKLKLLLPDPTEREVKRHLNDLSADAVALIEKARRTVPFLAKWKGFPPRDIPRHDLYVVGLGEWQSFLKQFDVVRLNYDGITIGKVMNWCDAAEPPFDKGKKRKEFPDAFAIAILSAYAEQHSCYVAVVSQDLDFKKACDRFPSLMYFQSLPVLTELLLSADDSRVSMLRGVLDAAIDTIAEAAYEATFDLSFYASHGYSEIRESEVQELDIADMRVVALGEHECTIAFDAVIRVAHDVEWFETGPDNEPESHHETAKKEYDVSGTAKVSLDEKTNTVVSVPFAALNEEEIEVTGSLPPFWARW